MLRSSLPVFAPVLLLAAACQPSAPETQEIPYPKMSLNQDTVEFGTLQFGETATRTVTITNTGYTQIENAYIGMQMGVGTKADETTGIDVSTSGMAGFSVAYDAADITCPEGSESTAEGDAAADAKTDAGGTGGGGGGNGGTGGGGGGGNGGTGGGGGGGGGDGDEGDGVSLFTLGPACSIPLTLTFSPVSDVGDVWGALTVESVQADQTADQEKNNELPAYLRDPTRYYQQVYMHAQAEQGQGTLIVSPRSIDFGYVYPGEDEELGRIELANVGTGDVILSGVTLASSCDPAISLKTSFAPNATLAAGQKTLVEMAFNPTDTDPAYCQLEIGSNDPSASAVKVTLTGNTGSDPNNTPPTVAVRWPEPGYEYNSPNPLEMEINFFDKNQPATSLTCRVKSSLLIANVASCEASDESGHVTVQIPRENLDPGIDTLQVIVTDASGLTSTASVSVLINTIYPDSDDDGDGYGVESTPPDCDDHNRETYPDAAEVYDGEDNDCDGITDEGTEGADDDGDGLTEADGDCNDYDAQAYTGAPERSDSVDNDCDGRVDEGTGLYDDDGDGFAEVNNDCDDSDPELNPAAVELCDGYDNDCDGLKDSADQCVSTNSEPMIIGEPRPSQNACLENEQISFSVKVFDADGQIPTYSWNDDDAKGAALFDNTVAQNVNFTCPDLDSSSSGKNVTVFVLVQDPDGHQTWGKTKIAVFPEDYPLYDTYTLVTQPADPGACAGSPLFLLGGLTAMGAFAARRRRQA